MQYIHVGWASPTEMVGEAHPTFFQVKLEALCYTPRGHKFTFSVFSQRRKDRKEYKNFASLAPLREIKKNAIYALAEYIRAARLLRQAARSFHFIYLPAGRQVRLPWRSGDI